MNIITDLATNITGGYIDSSMVMETISVTAQTALSSNPYLLFGGVVITSGVALYNAIKGSQIGAPQTQTAEIEEIAQKAIPIEPKTRIEITDNGDRYEGEFQNGKWHGRGLFISVDGDRYEGEFKEGQWDGMGVCRFADGSKYTGEFKEDLLHGYGILQLPNGDEYKGEFQNGEYQGDGILTYADGEVYRGEFKNNQQNGFGIAEHGSGATYKGTFVDDMRQGVGVMTSCTGEVYEGEFADDNAHGFGITNAGEKRFIGKFKNGKKDGDFLIQSDSLKINEIVQYKNGNIINTSKENIGDNQFLSQAFGLSGAGINSGYSLGIISDHMLNHFENDPESLKAAVIPLREATQFCAIDPDELDQKTEEVFDGIKNGRSALLPYGFNGHAMLLNIIPTPDGKFVEFELYNSGEGLKNHDHDKDTNKYQLMKKYRIPMEEWKIDILQEIMSFSTFISPSHTYSVISTIEGAVHVKLPPEEQLWKKPQKGGNCEAECIAAFAAQKLQSRYKPWRKKFFQDCLNAANEELRQEPRVQKKITTLQLTT